MSSIRINNISVPVISSKENVIIVPSIRTELLHAEITINESVLFGEYFTKKEQMFIKLPVEIDDRLKEYTFKVVVSENSEDWGVFFNERSANTSLYSITNLPPVLVEEAVITPPPAPVVSVPEIQPDVEKAELIKECQELKNQLVEKEEELESRDSQIIESDLQEYKSTLLQEYFSVTQKIIQESEKFKVDLNNVFENYKSTAVDNFLKTIDQNNKELFKQSTDSLKSNLLKEFAQFKDSLTQEALTTTTTIAHNAEKSQHELTERVQQIVEEFTDGSITTLNEARDEILHQMLYSVDEKVSSNIETLSTNLFTGLSQPLNQQFDELNDEISQHIDEQVFILKQDISSQLTLLTTQVNEISIPHIQNECNLYLESRITDKFNQLDNTVTLKVDGLIKSSEQRINTIINECVNLLKSNLDNQISSLVVEKKVNGSKSLPQKDSDQIFKDLQQYVDKNVNRLRQQIARASDSGGGSGAPNTTTVISGGSGSTVPGGNNLELQFNDNGAFGGMPNTTYNSSIQGIQSVGAKITNLSAANINLTNTTLVSGSMVTNGEFLQITVNGITKYIRLWDVYTS